MDFRVIKEVKNILYSSKNRIVSVRGNFLFIISVPSYRKEAVLWDGVDVVRIEPNKSVEEDLIEKIMSVITVPGSVYNNFWKSRIGGNRTMNILWVLVLFFFLKGLLSFFRRRRRTFKNILIIILLLIFLVILESWVPILKLKKKG